MGIIKKTHNAIGLSADVEAQLRLLLNALNAAEEGYFSVRLQVRKTGVMGT